MVGAAAQEYRIVPGPKQRAQTQGVWRICLVVGVSVGTCVGLSVGARVIAFGAAPIGVLGMRVGVTVGRRDGSSVGTAEGSIECGRRGGTHVRHAYHTEARYTLRGQGPQEDPSE
jgi:hypothetical protein